MVNGIKLSPERHRSIPDMKIKVGERGRVTIPKTIEQQLGVKACVTRCDYYVDEPDLIIHFNDQGLFKVSAYGGLRISGGYACLLQVPKVLPPGLFDIEMTEDKLIIKGAIRK